MTPRRRSNQLPGSRSSAFVPPTQIKPLQPSTVDFNVWTRGNIGVYRCFIDIAHSVADSLRELGYNVAETFNAIQPHRGQLILVGANVLNDREALQIPSDAIIYQLEQLGTRHLNATYFQLLKSHPVWDFCPRNIARLKELGCPRVQLCRVGFSPHPVEPRHKEKDIDVLFLGHKTGRREVLLNQLRARKIVLHDSGAWGEERRELVARAKIVLNLHYYADSVLEMVRLGPILEQGAFVISEIGVDKEIEQPLEQGIVFSRYEHIVETVMNWLGRPEERDAVAARATEIFRATPQTDEVERCLLEMNYPRPTPIKCYIINRDRLTWTKNMVQEIRRFGGEPVIIDNASSYPPLLEWYAQADCRVIQLDKNLGCRAPWLSGAVDREVKQGERYIVTDPDLDLSTVPSDVFSVLTKGLDRYGVTKAGLSLEINDVPRELLDCQQVGGKTLEQIESGYWNDRADEKFWKAQVDTTFAMYRHGRPLEGAKFMEAVRADRPYTAKHLPWYRFEKDFDDEDRYYVQHREKKSAFNGTWYDVVASAKETIHGSPQEMDQGSSSDKTPLP